LLKRYIFYTMHQFEFDPRKSAANLAKHGVDFVAAQEIWMDPRMLQIDARSLDEPRTLVCSFEAGEPVGTGMDAVAQGAQRVTAAAAAAMARSVAAARANPSATACAL
jgi:hypothetical protein